jgi:CheY-like chemotaxis protein
MACPPIPPWLHRGSVEPHVSTSKRILIIDDEDDIREVAQVSLELVGGYEVLTAASGPDGVARARAEQPDAILLDVMMPGRDGPSTLLELRADPVTQHIPVVFLTAKNQTAERDRLTRLGADGVLTKPFDPLKLASDVAAALGWT